MTVHMSEAEELALSDALRAIAAAWRAFARETAEGNYEDAERWAEYCFEAFDAFEPLDDGPGWRVRDLLFLLDKEGS